MSFLLDPPLLVGAGAVIESKVKDDKLKLLLETSTVAMFIGTSVSLYLEKPHVKWLWKICGAKSGRDWMLNSGVFNFSYDNDDDVMTHLISGAIFATYPFWIRLGRKLVKTLKT